MDPTDEKKPTRVLDCKKVGRTPAIIYSWKENRPLFSPSLCCISISSLIFIHLSIYPASVYRSFLRQREHLSLFSLFFFFLPVCRSSSARCRFHAFVTRKTVAWALRWPDFLRSDRKCSKKRYNTGITKQFSSVKRCFLSTELIPHNNVI